MELLTKSSCRSSFQPLHRCINVVFDYQLFFGTIALGNKMKSLHGFFHTAELDSSHKSLIFLCFVMISIFVLTSSMSLGSSTLIVNFVAQ
ncbi:unnamed protein product [Brassica oleracea]